MIELWKAIYKIQNDVMHCLKEITMLHTQIKEHKKILEEIKLVCEHFHDNDCEEKEKKEIINTDFFVPFE